MKNLPSKPLSDNQKAFIVKNLALKKSPIQIKKEFLIFFEESVSGETIMNVEESCKTLIEKLSKEELNKIWDEPLAHSRVRLSLAYEGIKEAMERRIIVPAQRISESEWSSPVEGMDLKNLKALLELGLKEEYMAKKLMLEVKRLKLEAEKEELLSSGFQTITINTGLEDE